MWSGVSLNASISFGENTDYHPPSTLHSIESRSKLIEIERDRSSGTTWIWLLTSSTSVKGHPVKLNNHPAVYIQTRRKKKHWNHKTKPMFSFNSYFVRKVGFVVLSFSYIYMNHLIPYIHLD